MFGRDVRFDFVFCAPEEISKIDALYRKISVLTVLLKLAGLVCFSACVKAAKAAAASEGKRVVEARIILI